jgi:hypothetical protein
MINELKARLSANITGLTVVMMAAIVGLVVLSFSPLSDGLLLFSLIIIALPIAAVAYRICRGGDQGSTDLEITPDGMFIRNIPLGDVGNIFSRGLRAFARRPLPTPKGIVKGSPANAEDVLEVNDAELPADAEVSKDPTPLPEGGERLSGSVK